MAKLTKNKLLRSLEDTKEVPIDGFPPDTGDDGVVTFDIRPLSDKEMSEAENLMVRGVDINPKNLTSEKIKKIRKLREEGAGKKEIIKQVQDDFNAGNIDIARLQEQEREGTYLMVSYGLSHDEKWTPEDVGKLPKGVPDKLADEIQEISEFESQDEEDEKNL